MTTSKPGQKSKMRRKPRHRLSFYQPGLKTPVHKMIPMSDAEWPVTLDREEIDVYEGVPGSAVRCANSQCANRLESAFPHPVYLVEFTDTRAFVVDRVSKRTGEPVHCIRYYHHEGDEQREFDMPGGKERMIRERRVRKTFNLLAPTASIQHRANPNPRPRVEGERVKRTGPKLSLARYERSLPVRHTNPAATGSVDTP
jgi:hypothetical protein